MESIDLRLVYTRDACRAAENIKTKFSDHPYSLTVDMVYLEPGQSNRPCSSKNLLPAKANVLVVSPTLLASLDTMDIHGYFPDPISCLALLIWVENPGDTEEALKRHLPGYTDWNKLLVDGIASWGTAFISILTMVDEAEPLALPERKEFILLPPVVHSLEDPVYIVFDEELPGTPSSITVRFENGLDVVASRHPNHLLYEFYCPGITASSVGVTLYAGEDCVGRDTLIIQSKMDTVSAILRDVNNPIEFLCQALEVSQISHDDLDLELTDGFRNGFLGMKGSFFMEGHAQPDARQQELPTLLHLGARLGLAHFCHLLLKSPGGSVAMATRNKDGRLPSEIARQYGHASLADAIESKVSAENLPSPSEDEEPYMNLQTSTMFKWRDSQITLRRCPAIRHRSKSDADATENLIQGRGLTPSGGNLHCSFRESVNSDRSSGCVADLPSDTETEWLRRSPSSRATLRVSQPGEFRLKRDGTNMSQRLTCLITDVNRKQYTIPERRESDHINTADVGTALRAHLLNRPPAPLPPDAVTARAAVGHASMGVSDSEHAGQDCSPVRESTKF